MLGSEYFVAHPPLKLDSAQLYMNFDMVGRLRDDRLIVYGVATATELKPLLDSLNVAVCAAVLLYEARAQMSGW